MKKLLTFLLALCMLLAAVPAMAAAPTVNLLFSETPIDVPLNGQAHHIEIVPGSSSYEVFFFWEEDGALQYDNSGSSEDWYYNPMGNDMSQKEWERIGVRPWVTYVNGDFGKVAVEWYSTYVEINGKPYIRLSVNPWEVDEKGKLVEIEVEDGESFLNKNKDAMESIIDQEGQEGGKSEPTAYPAIWYPHNTICVAGIEFRAVRPELTEKWYTFAAIDLSEDGVQVYDLVASNTYVIGTVSVSKNGDEVIVTWEVNRQDTNDANFQLENEFLTFFSDLDAITELEPADFKGAVYEFGQPISIADDLNGDTNVLLYICNQATYCDNLSYQNRNPIYHPWYWPNLDWRVAQREAMMALVNADLEK